MDQILQYTIDLVKEVSAVTEVSRHVNIFYFYLFNIQYFHGVYLVIVFVADCFNN